MKLAIVTATTNLDRAQAAIDSWKTRANDPFLPVCIVPNGKLLGYKGTVPVFREGVDDVLAHTQADVIACFHDDFFITERDWDVKMLGYFERRAEIGLVGFGGAIALGASDIYKAPYDPMQLVRYGFRSNLVDAEAHGMRSLLAERVACLDGFSQIGRRAFWEGHHRDADPYFATQVPAENRPWTVLESLGLVHHIYDGALGCLAARYGWETWYIPCAGKHEGGQTAVADPGYGDWAKTIHPQGDRGFWEAGHRIVYDNFQDVLPLRV